MMHAYSVNKQSSQWWWTHASLAFKHDRCVLILLKRQVVAAMVAASIEYRMTISISIEKKNHFRGTIFSIDF